MFELYQSPCVSVVMYASVGTAGLNVIDSTSRPDVIRVHDWPRLVVLYSPPRPLASPPQPLNTPAYHVFCAGSPGSTTTSLVQKRIPGSLRSAHVWPPSVETNTPELAVKLTGD